MKLFKHINIANVLLAAVPAALMVPNVMLWVLRHDLPAIQIIASLLLPLGVYLLLMGWSRNTPRTSLFLLPVMFICAFQIVVSVLFHNSEPIGVDMFLNAATTNSSEVNELLSSLMMPVGSVLIIYIPVIAMTVAGCIRHKKSTLKGKRISQYSGFTITFGGLVTTIACVMTVPGYSFRTSMFPVNSFANLGEAISREYKTMHYEGTSSSFNYGAKSTRPEEKELYIAVIGESARADNWDLFGYGRPTTPGIKKYKDSMVGFKGVFSESNTTHKAVPMLLNTLSAENFDRDIYKHKSIITAFKEAGFATAYISNQERNNSFIDRYSAESDHPVYISHAGGVTCDQTILPVVDSLLSRINERKILLVIHLYGSHYKYNDRYPDSLSVFTPDIAKTSGLNDLEAVRNAYDNTILNTDRVLSDLMNRVSCLDRSAALLYCSDHGEDLYDDDRNRFLHSSPTPSYWQLHVPMCLYANESYQKKHENLINNAIRTSGMVVSSSQSYSHTLLQMAGVETSRLDYTKSILSEKYKQPECLYFLNDRNIAMNLGDSGISNVDIDNIRKIAAGFVVDPLNNSNGQNLISEAITDKHSE